MNTIRKYLSIIPKLRRRSKLEKLLYKEPFPIIFPQKQLVLLWSAKAGCTFSIKWMYSQMGVLKDPLVSQKWVHKYRQNEYYGSKQHKEGIRLFKQNSENFRIIKIVSDPFRRAVSSFIHATIHSYEDKLLSDFLGRRIDSKIRFSFREFVMYLNSIDLKKCDVHHRLQTSDLERLGLVSSINLVHLEDSMEEIPILENHLQLNKIDLEPLRKSPHHRPKFSTTEFMGDVKFNNIYNIKNPTIPVYESFYDSEIQAIIANAYQEDFIRYNFDSSMTKK